MAAGLLDGALPPGLQDSPPDLAAQLDQVPAGTPQAQQHSGRAASALPAHPSNHVQPPHRPASNWHQQAGQGQPARPAAAATPSGGQAATRSQQLTGFEAWQQQQLQRLQAQPQPAWAPPPTSSGSLAPGSFVGGSFVAGHAPQAQASLPGGALACATGTQSAGTSA